MEIFDTKEIAYLVWILLGLYICLQINLIRQSIFRFLRATFVKEIIVTYLLAVLYTCLWVVILYQNGHWDISLLKDTILWLLLVPSVTIFKISEVSENKDYFKNAIKENFKLTVVLEFLVGLYDFSIWLELLLIPFALITGYILAYSKFHKKFNKATAFLNNFLIVAGIIMIAFALYKVGRHYQDFLKIATLNESILPIILSLTFIPFIYMLFFYVNYEDTFIIINRALNLKDLSNYAKKESIVRFNIDTKGLKRWSHRLFFNDIKSKRDIDKTIDTIKKLQTIENNPPIINADLGWSPYKAKEFLNNDGISTGYYINNYDNDWSACSNSIKLDEEILSNNISYFVNGNCLVATSLKLVLNIFDQGIVNDAHLKLLNYAESLYKKALNKPMPLNINNAIIFGKEINFNETLAVIYIRKEQWQNRTNGYSIKFEIKHKTALD